MSKAKGKVIGLTEAGHRSLRQKLKRMAQIQRETEVIYDPIRKRMDDLQNEYKVLEETARPLVEKVGGIYTYENITAKVTPSSVWKGDARKLFAACGEWVLDILQIASGKFREAYDRGQFKDIDLKGIAELEERKPTFTLTVK